MRPGDPHPPVGLCVCKGIPVDDPDACREVVAYGNICENCRENHPEVAMNGWAGSARAEAVPEAGGAEDA